MLGVVTGFKSGVTLESLYLLLFPGFGPPPAQEPFLLSSCARGPASVYVFFGINNHGHYSKA